MIKLFTVGFPRDTDELQLVELFSVHGLVSTVTIIRDQLTGTSKAYAFIEMLDEPGATRAIAALNGFVLAGRTLSVRVAADKRQEDVPVNKTPPARFEEPGRQSAISQRHTGKTKRPRR